MDGGSLERRKKRVREEEKESGHGKLPSFMKEVCSLLGSVALDNEEASVHCHADKLRKVF